MNERELVDEGEFDRMRRGSMLLLFLVFFFFGFMRDSK